MRFNIFNKVAAISALGFVIVTGTSVAANAQGNRKGGQQQQQTQKAVQQQGQWEQQRSRNDQDRNRVAQQQKPVMQQHPTVQAGPLQQQRRQIVNQPTVQAGPVIVRHDDRRNDNRRVDPVVAQRPIDRNFNRGNDNRPNTIVNFNVGRYRVYRSGSWYNTDNRGADLLRQAVNDGYQQGYFAGQNDRNAGYPMNYGGSSIYRAGTFGWDSYVDRGQYQYYFQQGFERGYQDGYNSQFEYGYDNGGTVGILDTILGSILDIQTY